jgi:DNA primase large subunit
MARFTEPTPSQEVEWNEWVASRPDRVREVAEKFDPWSLYLLKSSGHRVKLHSFQESVKDGSVTITVLVLGQWNKIAFERNVFGIKPDELEPCELPGPEVEVGTVLNTAEEVQAFIAYRRKKMLESN